MRVLRSRLYEIEMEKQQQALAKERKAMVGSATAARRFALIFSQNRLTTIGLDSPSTSWKP